MQFDHELKQTYSFVLSIIGVSAGDNRVWRANVVAASEIGIKSLIMLGIPKRADCRSCPTTLSVVHVL